MRTFLLFAAATATFASPLGAATRNFGITSFTKVRVDGPFIIRLQTGVAPFARARGSETALDRIAVDVEGDTLVVHNDVKSSSNDPGKDLGPVEIALGTHDLSTAWLNGSGTLAIDRVRALKFDLSVQGSGIATLDNADVDQLTVGVFGTAAARLAGRAARLTAIARGISSVDVGGLAVKDATLGIDGAGTISANVSNAASVEARGPATVRLAGKPACTLHVSGAATVTGCR